MRSRKWRWVKRIVILTVVVIAIALCQDDEASAAQGLYCEMVSIYMATDGQHGWPDYRGVYKELCDGTD